MLASLGTLCAMCALGAASASADEPALFDDSALLSSLDRPMGEIAPSVAAWEMALARRARALWNSTVYLIVTNCRFRRAFANVIASAELLMGLVPVIVALDSETRRFFQSRRVPVIQYMPLSAAASELSFDGDDALMRYFFTWRFLVHGLRVVYSDIDVFLLRDPLPFDRLEAEIVVEAHTYDEEICSGFYIVKPTEATLRLFKTLLYWIRHFCAQSLCHQTAFDYALRGVPNYDLPGNFSPGDLRPLRGLGVSWDFLPIREFMHYTVPRRPETPAHWLCLGDHPVVAAHIWRAAGSVDARILLACALGAWQAAAPPGIPWPPESCRWCADGWQVHPADLAACGGGAAE